MQPRPKAEQCKNIEYVGFHDLNGKPGFKIAIQCVEDKWYLYIGHLFHPGWSILDVTDPGKPCLLNHIPGPENTMTCQVNVADGIMITALQKLGGGAIPDDRAHLLFGHDPTKPFEEGLRIWDVKNPAEPKLLSVFQTGGHGTHRNFYNGGKYAYLAANMNGYRQNIFVTLDISNPANPTEVSRWHFPGQWKDNGEIGQDIHALHGPAYVEGNYAYLPYGRYGAVVLDISDISRPRMVKHLSIGDFGTVVGVHSFLPIPEKGIGIISTEGTYDTRDENDNVIKRLNVGNFVAVVEINDPDKLNILSLFPTPMAEAGFTSFSKKIGPFGPHNLHMPQSHPDMQPVSDIIHLCYYNAGLRIIDVSDPILPREVGYFVPEDPVIKNGLLPLGDKLVPQFDDVAVDRRGYAYVVDRNYGLFVLRYTGES